MDTAPCFVGVDVAKARLDIAVRPGDDFWRLANDAAGAAALVARLHELQPALVVLEATGGDERPLVAALAAAGLPVAVVNPRQVRDFARATGRLAKTDALDARTLAHFAEAVQPPARPVPEAQAGCGATNHRPFGRCVARGSCAIGCLSGRETCPAASRCCWRRGTSPALHPPPPYTSIRGQLSSLSCPDVHARLAPA